MVTLTTLTHYLEESRPAVVVWNDLDDVDKRRLRLYHSGERDQLRAALHAHYEPSGEGAGWRLFRRRPVRIGQPLPILTYTGREDILRPGRPQEPISAL
jgi:hypothetical protein